MRLDIHAGNIAPPLPSPIVLSLHIALHQLTSDFAAIAWLFDIATFSVSLPTD